MNVEEAAPFPRPSFSRKREPGDFALAALPALPESSPDSSSPRRRGSISNECVWINGQEMGCRPQFGPGRGNDEFF
jgi:hypothetical protein